MHNSISIPHIDYLKNICQQLTECKSHIEAKELTEIIVSAYPVINYDIKLDQDFRLLRSRKCDRNIYNNISELLSPPASLTKPGRLNSKNRPILYASKNIWATYDEIGAKKRDIIQSAVLKIKKSSLRVCSIGEYKLAQRWGGISKSILSDFLLKFVKDLAQNNKEAFKSIIYLDSFLSSALRDKYAKENDYLTTQYLAEEIFKNNPEIDGIFYKGVESDEALNIAIQENKVSSLIEVDRLLVCGIVENHGYGIYDHNILHASKSVAADGSIEWQ